MISALYIFHTHITAPGRIGFHQSEQYWKNWYSPQVTHWSEGGKYISTKFMLSIQSAYLMPIRYRWGRIYDNYIESKFSVKNMQYLMNLGKFQIHDHANTHNSMVISENDSCHCHLMGQRRVRFVMFSTWEIILN